MYNAYETNTLKFNTELCTGCGICLDVCPHDVFIQSGRTIQMAHSQACMECGACQKNCPFGAITVESGVGCAAAMMRAALTRRTQVSCG
ncbi:MAG: ferredoxin family protein [Chloroflexota bacterium]|nr:MAG: ferredoxin family protein [Chloroflexota bacterium]